MAKKPVPQCGNCLFGQATTIRRHGSSIVACRRFPPAQEGNQQTPGPYPFPMVKGFEWCGEYKPQTENEDG